MEENKLSSWGMCTSVYFSKMSECSLCMYWFKLSTIEYQMLPTLPFEMQRVRSFSISLYHTFPWVNTKAEHHSISVRSAKWESHPLVANSVSLLLLLHCLRIHSSAQGCLDYKQPNYHATSGLLAVWGWQGTSAYRAVASPLAVCFECTQSPAMQLLFLTTCWFLSFLVCTTFLLYIEQWNCPSGIHHPQKQLLLL